MISYDNSQDILALTGSITSAYTNTGNYLFVNTDNTVTNLKYNGVSLSQLQSFTPSTPPFGANCPPIVVWGLANPFIGTANITFDISADRDVTVVSLIGASTGIQPDASTTNDTHLGQANTISTSVTSIKDGDWILGFIRGANNSPHTWVAHSGSNLVQGGNGSVLVEACAIVDLNASEPIGTYSVGADWDVGSGFSTMITMAISPQDTSLIGQMLIL